MYTILTYESFGKGAISKSQPRSTITIYVTIWDFQYAMPYIFVEYNQYSIIIKIVLQI